MSLLLKYFPGLRAFERIAIPDPDCSGDSWNFGDNPDPYRDYPNYHVDYPGDYPDSLVDYPDPSSDNPNYHVDYSDSPSDCFVYPGGWVGGSAGSKASSAPLELWLSLAKMNN